jgi:transposase
LSDNHRAHFKAGKNRAEVARTLNVSRRIANEWVAKYLKGGISALESKKPSGRPCLLTVQQKVALEITLRNKATPVKEVA